MFKTLSQRRLLLAALATGAALPPWPARSERLATASSAMGEAIVAAARGQIGITTRYDPRYQQMAYPGGDVPLAAGVCTDVIIRALRQLGVDLQQRIHNDMRLHFAVYPQRHGAARPDTHIDHRRVPNQMTYFARHGMAVTGIRRPPAFAAGDIAAWDLGRGQKHIGIISDRFASNWFGRPTHPLVIHNIANGVQEEDVLTSWPIIGHYRWQG